MTAWIHLQIKSIISGWNWFWFDSRSDNELVPLALFRLSFCAVMLFCYITRIPDISFFYTADGILPHWHIKNVDFFRYHPTILSDGWSLGAIQAMHGIFLGLLFFQAIGLFTRFSAIGAYLLHMMFINRNMSVMFGVDMIATFFLLYLCFVDSNARFSVDAWRKKGAKRNSALSHIFWRLMQLQVCIVYGFSGLEKLKGTRWWDGSAIWDVLSIGNMQRWDLSFVANFPILLSIAVYVVLIFEIYFPALIWLKKWRLPLLLFGTVMHIGIYLFMNLPSFGFMMISLYFLFLKKQEILDGIAGISGKIPFSRPRRS